LKSKVDLAVANDAPPVSPSGAAAAGSAEELATQLVQSDMCSTGVPEVPQTPQQHPLADASVASLEGEADPAQKDALSDIPESRLVVEVQSLLVSVNLDAMTVGQLRTALEKRLGLQAGTLGSKKSLRRRVGQLFQQEVLKKSQRNPDCERIAKALVDYEDYPASVRQMLMESLPHALASRPLHDHQVRLLGIARDALSDFRGQLAEKLTCSQASCDLSEVEVCGREASRQGAVSVEEQASARAASAEALLQEAVEEAQRAEFQLSQAEQRIKVAADEVAELLRARETAVAVSEGPLQLLLVGEWADAKDREKAITEIRQHLEMLNAEDAILAAADVALRHRPTERTRFDLVTVDSVQRLFAMQQESQEGRLAEKPEFQAESKRLAASAFLGVAVQRQQEQAEACKAARKSLEEALEARRETDKELAAAAATAETHQKQRADLQERLSELDETLSVVDRLTSGEPSTPEKAVPEALMKDIIVETAADGETNDSAADKLATQDTTGEADEEEPEEGATLQQSGDEVALPVVEAEEALTSLVKPKAPAPDEEDNNNNTKEAMEEEEAQLDLQKPSLDASPDASAFEKLTRSPSTRDAGLRTLQRVPTPLSPGGLAVSGRLA
jgi:hypothetical protein